MNTALRWVSFVFFLGVPFRSAQVLRPAIDIPEAEAAEHRIGGRGPLYTNMGDQQFAVTLEVVVGTDGKAACSQTGPGFLGDLTLLCQTWQYRPFLRDGNPVRAKLRESIVILPMHERPEVHVPFPEVQNWNSLRISLSRSGCYGMCSTYEIEIQGDGTVLYNGKAYVSPVGKRTLKISQASLVKLVEAFRKADYFSLADGYVSGVTDNPTWVSSISFDGRFKSVLDYVGRDVGMPPGVSDVEAAIDRLSGAFK